MTWTFELVQIVLKWFDLDSGLWKQDIGAGSRQTRSQIVHQLYMAFLPLTPRWLFETGESRLSKHLFLFYHHATKGRGVARIAHIVVSISVCGMWEKGLCVRDLREKCRFETRMRSHLFGSEGQWSF